MEDISIRRGGISSLHVERLLQEHIDDMRSLSPPESKHALSLHELSACDIRFWTVWRKDMLLACGALKELAHDHAELKSMRTAREHRGAGVASRLLEFLLVESRARGYRTVSLETGSMPFFQPAHALYKKFGFEICPPFANYEKDPNSIFMSLKI